MESDANPSYESAPADRVTFQPDRRHRRHERVSPLLAPWLVPATGLSWLGREPEILDTWLATIQGDLDHAGPLGALISQADGLSVARDKIAFAMGELSGDVWLMEPVESVEGE